MMRWPPLSPSPLEARFSSRSELLPGRAAAMVTAPCSPTWFQERSSSSRRQLGLVRNLHMYSVPSAAISLPEMRTSCSLLGWLASTEKRSFVSAQVMPQLDRSRSSTTVRALKKEARACMPSSCMSFRERSRASRVAKDMCRMITGRERLVRRLSDIPRHSRWCTDSRQQPRHTPLSSPMLYLDRMMDTWRGSSEARLMNCSGSTPRSSCCSNSVSCAWRRLLRASISSNSSCRSSSTPPPKSRLPVCSIPRRRLWFRPTFRPSMALCTRENFSGLGCSTSRARPWGDRGLRLVPRVVRRRVTREAKVLTVRTGETRMDWCVFIRVCSVSRCASSCAV
mmetsp:Transcript_3538/g.8039  ORF Transcript_3538/g.8039 Transcript_3538/m.8039 type:complete len:338 (+) Transcript_3538:2052-3065(+)